MCYYYNGELVYREYAYSTGDCGGTPTDDRVPDPDGGMAAVEDIDFILTLDPCSEKNLLSAQGKDENINALNNAILTNTQNTGFEYGAAENLDYWPNGSFIYIGTVTNNSKNSVNVPFSWNSSQGFTIGATHTHPGGSAPSPADVFYLIGNLGNADLNAAGQTAINYYKTTASLTVVTTSGKYTLNVSDWNALQTQYNNFLADQDAFNANYASIARNNNNSTEYALLSIFGSSINVFKADVNATSYTPLIINNDNTVADEPCS